MRKGGVEPAGGSGVWGCSIRVLVYKKHSLMVRASLILSYAGLEENDGHFLVSCFQAAMVAKSKSFLDVLALL